MTEESAPAVPPEQPGAARWRKLGQAFVITLIFGLITGVGAWAFEMTALATRLSSFNESIGYGLRSLSAGVLVKELLERSGDRYHWAVRNRQAPFNLSEACRKNTASAYGSEVGGLCAYQPERFPVPFPTPLGSPGIKFPPARPLPSPWRTPLLPASPPDVTLSNPTIRFPPRTVEPVDEKKYPRGFSEFVLMLPDALVHLLDCAWSGVGSCGSKSYTADSAGAAPPGNWLGKLVIVLVAVFAFVASLAHTKEEKSGPGWLVLYFPFAFLVTLGIVSFYTMPVRLVHGLLTFLGGAVLSFFTALTTLAAFAPVGFVLAAVKDVTADQVKDFMSRKIFGDGDRKPQA